MLYSIAILALCLRQPLGLPLLFVFYVIQSLILYLSLVARLGNRLHRFLLLFAAFSYLSSVEVCPLPTTHLFLWSLQVFPSLSEYVSPVLVDHNP